MADQAHGRAVLSGLAGVATVAQLGTRLRALIEPTVSDPVDLIQRALRESRLAGETRRVEPNLEDVFMAVTR